VRTTLTLEEDVASGLKAEARRSGRSFKDVVNECLRAGLAQRGSTRAAPRFSVQPRDMGKLRPGLSLDNVADLLERIEGPEHT
jgi:plasmid stability protein